eukprot:6213012-Pleurochrysis_carterae.AAC.2
MLWVRTSKFDAGSQQPCQSQRRKQKRGSGSPWKDTPSGGSPTFKVAGACHQCPPKSGSSKTRSAHTRIDMRDLEMKECLLHAQSEVTGAA